jgi:hypothetical protein
MPRERNGHVAPSTTGGSCYAIRVDTATSGPSCQPAPAATELHPLQLVAYDSEGRVIGVKTLQVERRHGQRGPLPITNAHWRSLVKTKGGEVFPTTRDSSSSSEDVSARDGLARREPRGTTADRLRLEQKQRRNHRPRRFRRRTRRRQTPKRRDPNSRTGQGLHLWRPAAAKFCDIEPEPGALDHRVRRERSSTDTADSQPGRRIRNDHPTDAHVDPNRFASGGAHLPRHAAIAFAQRLRARNTRPIHLRQRNSQPDRPINPTQIGEMGRQNDLGERPDHKAQRIDDHGSQHSRPSGLARRIYKLRTYQDIPTNRSLPPH